MCGHAGFYDHLIRARVSEPRTVSTRLDGMTKNIDSDELRFERSRDVWAATEPLPLLIPKSQWSTPREGVETWLFLREFTDQNMNRRVYFSGVADQSEVDADGGITFVDVRFESEAAFLREAADARGSEACALIPDASFSD